MIVGRTLQFLHDRVLGSFDHQVEQIGTANCQDKDNELSFDCQLAQINVNDFSGEEIA